MNSKLLHSLDQSVNTSFFSKFETKLLVMFPGKLITDSS